MGLSWIKTWYMWVPMTKIHIKEEILFFFTNFLSLISLSNGICVHFLASHTIEFLIFTESLKYKTKRTNFLKEYLDIFLNAYKLVAS